MKKFIELSDDCIIEYKFVEKRINTTDIDWVDFDKKIANGNNFVKGVRIITEDYGNDGYKTGKLNQTWLSKDDILKLAEQIKQLEIPTTGIPSDDLPF